MGRRKLKNKKVKNVKIRIVTDDGQVYAMQNDKKNAEMDESICENPQKKINLFLSYCWKDEKIADDIYDFLTQNTQVVIYRDKICIGAWRSIKEFMHMIADMDYVILLISDSYLRSVNCMYEVLEVMRDRNYRERIFPAIINKGIYNALERVQCVKFWEEEYDKLNNALVGIKAQNIGGLGEDLKIRQNIASNMADFLDDIADMNNPREEDVCSEIENRLKKVLLNLK